MHRFKAQSRTFVSTGLALLALTFALPAAMPAIAHAAPAAPALATVAGSGEEVGSLEAAASKAGETGRKIAMSLIALGFAVASIVLAFRRDFKEAVGVFAVGLVAIILATPAGVDVLHNTVNTLFGSSSS
jgi:hypothetical protein